MHPLLFWELACLRWHHLGYLKDRVDCIASKPAPTGKTGVFESIKKAAVKQRPRKTFIKELQINVRVNRGLQSRYDSMRVTGTRAGKFDKDKGCLLGE